jgi:hypothetical protein
MIIWHQLAASWRLINNVDNKSDEERITEYIRERQHRTIQTIKECIFAPSPLEAILREEDEEDII